MGCSYMILANIDWLPNVLTAIGTAAATLITIWAYFRKQNAAISLQAEKDAYEMNKVRSSDAYQQLLEARKDDIADRANIRLIIAAQDKRITELVVLEEEYQRRSIEQGLRIYELETIKTFLEARVKALEAIITSPEILTKQASAVAEGIVSLAAATAGHLADKARVDEQMVLDRNRLNLETLKACAENTPGCPRRQEQGSVQET